MLMLDFLSRLEKLLPVPDIQQVQNILFVHSIIIYLFLDPVIFNLSRYFSLQSLFKLFTCSL